MYLAVGSTFQKAIGMGACQTCLDPIDSRSYWQEDLVRLVPPQTPAVRGSRGPCRSDLQIDDWGRPLGGRTNPFSRVAAKVLSVAKSR